MNSAPHLTKLRDYPYTCSHRKHTSIEDLPFEVLSLIFEQTIPTDKDLDEEYVYSHEESFRHLHQAIVLSSVTRRLRQAALGTSELWKKLPLRMDRPLDQLVSLLEHCASYSLLLHITISKDQNQSDAHAPSKAEILFSPEIAQKIEFLDLYESEALEFWIPLLPSFAMLKTLIISNLNDWEYSSYDLDLESLPRLTQLYLEMTTVDSVILPPSVQFLYLVNVPQYMITSLLPQCPNLVMCTSLTDRIYPDFENSYPQVITFDHLKRLTWQIDSGFTSTSSVRNIRMPALEYLTLYSFSYTTPTIPAAVILMCHGVSTTLTTFRLSVTKAEDVWQYDDFYRLFTLPLRNLTTLGIQVHFHTLEAVIRALTPGGDGRNTPENNHLPNLNDLTLEAPYEDGGRRDSEYADILPPLLLKLLKEWRVGETSHFRLFLHIGPDLTRSQSWTPDIQREMEAIRRDRQIDLTIK